MILIFGGAYQGKLAYTMERFDLTENDVYKCAVEDINMPDNKVIYEIDKWILALTKANADIEQAVRQFMDSNGDAVVICNDISCGIVPMDPVSRKWREATGRALAVLSKNSDEVIRLFCGIPTRIK